MNFRQSARNRRGATAVEFALTSGILFAFLLASLEFTRAFTMLHSADNAVYEGARRGIVPGATAAAVRTEATEIMTLVGARNIDVTVDPATITNDTKEVTVAIEVPMNRNSFIAPFLFRNRVIQSEITMKREELDQTSVP